MMFISPWTCLVLGLVIASGSCKKKHCKRNLKPINYNLKDAYCDQPLFVTFVQKTDENMMIDNICHTYFPLPDDPDTYQVYYSRVFCDGSTEIMTYIATQMETGIAKFASPYCTFTSTIFGYAGCDTHLGYKCIEFGDCGGVNGTLIYGLSTQCKAIGLSCLRKVEELITSNGFTCEDYYVLPMKLQNRCVTEQICIKPPNPFHETFLKPTNSLQDVVTKFIRPY